MKRRNWRNHKVENWGPRPKYHHTVTPNPNPYVALWLRPSEDFDGHFAYKWTPYLVPRDDGACEERRFATKTEAEQFIELMIAVERRDLGLEEDEDGERDIRRKEQ